MTDIIITGLMIGEDFINVQYAEPREQARAVSITRSMTIDLEHVEEEMNLLLDTMQDIIDKGALLIRNPPQRIRRRTATDDLIEDLEDEIDGELE
jgi:hypothetical protein